MKQGGLGSRLIVAAWGGPIVLVLTWLGGWWLAALVAAVAVEAQDEYYRLLTVAHGYRPLRWLGLAGGLAVIIGWHFGGGVLHQVLLVAAVVILAAGILTGRGHRDVLATLSGLCYPPLLAGSFLAIRGWEPGGGALSCEGRLLAICLWGALWVGDTAAYAGGSLLGRRPLALSISPKKTIEGSLFGLAGAVGFALLWWGLSLARLDTAIAVGLAAGTIGQVGDLVESKIKREAGVKDSGRILPGHGGALDRFDSLLFAAPTVALYLTIRSLFL